MLNSDREILEKALRAFHKTNGGLPAGRVECDFDGLAGLPDGCSVGPVMGIGVYRSASIGKGKYSFKDLSGTVLAAN